MIYHLWFYSVYSHNFQGRNLKKLHSLTMESLTGSRYFSFLLKSQTGPGAHPASYSVGAEGSSLEVKRQVYEDDLSPPNSFEVKHEWSYTSTPFMAWTWPTLPFSNFTLYGILFFPMHASHTHPIQSPSTTVYIKLYSVFCHKSSKTKDGVVQLSSFFIYLFFFLFFTG